MRDRASRWRVAREESVHRRLTRPHTRSRPCLAAGEIARGGAVLQPHALAPFACLCLFAVEATKPLRQHVSPRSRAPRSPGRRLGWGGGAAAARARARGGAGARLLSPLRGVACALRCAKLRVVRQHLVLPLRGAHLLQLVEGRAAARLLRGLGEEAAPQRRSVCCTPVQHYAAWRAACWCCVQCWRGGFGTVLPAAASGARHARRRAWPGRRQRARSMSQPARRERRASWHIVCMLPSILWSTAVNLTIVDQNRRAL